MMTKLSTAHILQLAMHSALIIFFKLYEVMSEYIIIMILLY
jgi:hypothetical protein